MKSTDITKIYMGDTQGQKLFLGDDLIWPVGGPTPTGDTHVIACIYDINSTSRQTPLTYSNTCAVKVELEDGTDIPLTTGATGDSSGVSSYQFSTTGEQIVYVTVTGSTIDTLFLGCSRLKSVVIPEGITSLYRTFFMPTSTPWIGPLYTTSVLDTVVLPSTLVTIGESVFVRCVSLTNITIPSGVTSFGNLAFEECSNFTGITFPSSVTSIGEKVFAKCTSLTDIVFPNTVLSVGDGVMSGCTSLTGATLSTSIPYTSNYMFYGCTSLQSFTIPSHITRLGNYSFGHTGLVSIVIPNTVLELGDNTGQSGYIGGVFSVCTALTSVTIGSGITVIPPATFVGCTALPNITIPNNITIVNYRAFVDCSSLSAITLSRNTWGYGDACFENCISLETIEFPDSVTWIGANCMVNCSGLTAITLYSTTPPRTSDTGSIMNYIFGNYFFSTHYPIYVPCESVEAYKTAFPDYASGFTCVEPETRLAVTYNVTSTTQNTKIIYTGETSYSKIELGDGTEIPVAKTYTFPETGQTKVYYTLTGTSIPEQAFYNLRNIVGVELPSSGLEEIGASAFRNCNALAGVVTIQDNTTVGNGVFSGCTALTQVTIANDCNIGDNAFARCSGLTDLTIASGCNIGASAFNRCFGLTDLTIGSGCDIGTSAFTQCTGLTEVAIPSDTTVGNVAFSQCTGLTGITLPVECEIGEGGFSRCSGLTQVTIPSDSNLGASAFSGCTGLTDVTVQSGVTLGYRAFYGISYLKRVTIGPGVSFVSGATFNSTGYEEVILEGTPPQSKPSEMVFRGGGTNPYPIYVQDNQVDAWKQWFDLGPGTYSKEPVRYVVPISERALIPSTYKRLAYCCPYFRTMTYVEADYAKPGFDESMWAEYEFELRKIPTGTTEVHVFSGDNYRFAQIDTAGNWSVLRGGNSVSITTSPFPDAGSEDIYGVRTYTFFKNGDNIEVDGVVVGSVTDTGTSPDSIHPRFYSAMGSDDYATYGADGFLYRAKVGNKDEGSSLIAHYVPVQRRSDDVYGLWDFVTSTFLPQDNGTSGN